MCALDALGAAAVCRQLGLSGEAASVRASYTSSGNGQVIWIANATCAGTQQSLEQCQLNTTVLDKCASGYASIECLPPSGWWLLLPAERWPSSEAAGHPSPVWI